MQSEVRGTHSKRAAGFDEFSDAYEALLRDPVRDGFRGRNAGFFHLRKRDLIRDYFRRTGRDSATGRYLDVGCGKGELLELLRGDFREAAGCDVSGKMLESVAAGIDVRRQADPLRIPFPSESFDFITAVCVYHHVLPEARAALTREIARVLRPGGIFCIIEHNPWNPVTRWIVSRTPVDRDAILLPAPESRRILQQAGLMPHAQRYFLYFPAALYAALGRLEPMLRSIPLGGQYAVFGRKAGLAWQKNQL